MADVKTDKTEALKEEMKNLICVSGEENRDDLVECVLEDVRELDGLRDLKKDITKKDPKGNQTAFTFHDVACLELAAAKADYQNLNAYSELLQTIDKEKNKIEIDEEKKETPEEQRENWQKEMYKKLQQIVVFDSKNHLLTQAEGVVEFVNKVVDNFNKFQKSEKLRTQKDAIDLIINLNKRLLKLEPYMDITSLLNTKENGRLNLLNKKMESLGLFDQKEIEALKDQVNELQNMLKEHEQKVKMEEKKMREMEEVKNKLLVADVNLKGAMSQKAYLVVGRSKLDGFDAYVINQETFNKIKPEDIESHKVEVDGVRINEERGVLSFKALEHIKRNAIEISKYRLNEGIIPLLNDANAEIAEVENSEENVKKFREISSIANLKDKDLEVQPKTSHKFMKKTGIAAGVLVLAAAIAGVYVLGKDNGKTSDRYNDGYEAGKNDEQEKIDYTAKAIAYGEELAEKRMKENGTLTFDEEGNLVVSGLILNEKKDIDPKGLYELAINKVEAYKPKNSNKNYTNETIQGYFGYIGEKVATELCDNKISIATKDENGIAYDVYYLAGQTECSTEKVFMRDFLTHTVDYAPKDAATGTDSYSTRYLNTAKENLADGKISADEIEPAPQEVVDAASQEVEFAVSNKVREAVSVRYFSNEDKVIFAVSANGDNLYKIDLDDKKVIENNENLVDAIRTAADVTSAVNAGELFKGDEKVTRILERSGADVFVANTDMKLEGSTWKCSPTVFTYKDGSFTETYGVTACALDGTQDEKEMLTAAVCQNASHPECIFFEGTATTKVYDKNEMNEAVVSANANENDKNEYVDGKSINVDFERVR